MKQMRTIRMQHGPEIEQAAMTDIPYTVNAKSLSLTKDPQVQRTRKILMILIGVSIALTVGSITIVGNAESGLEKSTGNTQQDVLIREALISLLFNGFGLFTAYRFSSTGLRVYAWLSIIVLVLSSIAIGLCLFVGIVALAAVNYGPDKVSKVIIAGVTVSGSIFILICLIDFVLKVFIILFAFKLAKFIADNKHSTIQQI